jgi:hypothetical protein
MRSRRGTRASSIAGVGSRAPARREPHEVLSTPKICAKPASPLKLRTIFLLPTWQMSYGALGILEVVSKK